MPALTEYVRVLPSNPEASPACCHGPALLFDRVGKQFYACSACRDRKLCALYVRREDKMKVRTWEQIKLEVLPKSKHVMPPEILTEAFHFCEDCCRICIRPDCEHRLKPISKPEMSSPSTFLSQLPMNKSTAQYHFSKDSLELIGDIASKFSKVLCLGTPSVMEKLQNNTHIRSHLADIDRRFEAFYGEQTFTWFNMFNGLAFRKEEKSELWNFVKSEVQPQRDHPTNLLGDLLIVADPPFGGPLGPLSSTLRKISAKNTGSANIILVFPYFNEAQVKLHLQNVEMCDFSVRYRNQRKMKDSSPVRLFTDIPLNLIPLPEDKYKFCPECDRWVHEVNVHCKKCDSCCSKNHEKYRHCDICERCVKSKWIHCQNCSRCHLKEQCEARRGIERAPKKSGKPQQKKTLNKRLKVN